MISKSTLLFCKHVLILKSVHWIPRKYVEMKKKHQFTMEFVSITFKIIEHWNLRNNPLPIGFFILQLSLGIHVFVIMVHYTRWPGTSYLTTSFGLNFLSRKQVKGSRCYFGHEALMLLYRLLGPSFPERRLDLGSIGMHSWTDRCYHRVICGWWKHERYEISSSQIRSYHISWIWMLLTYYDLSF